MTTCYQFTRTEHQAPDDIEVHRSLQSCRSFGRNMLYVTFMSHRETARRFLHKLWTPEAEYKANHYFVHPISEYRTSMKLHQRTLFLDISFISLQVSPTAATSSLTFSFSSFSVFLIYYILGGFQLKTASLCQTTPSSARQIHIAIGFSCSLLHSSSRETR